MSAQLRINQAESTLDWAGKVEDPQEQMVTALRGIGYALTAVAEAIAEAGDTDAGAPSERSGRVL